MSATPGAGAESSGPGPAEQAILDARYVDNKGMPLPFSAQYPYYTKYCDEFKMLPVVMTLVMDQRRLPKLLTAFANSTMPIEVTRVRILKTQSDDAESTPSPGRTAPMGRPRGSVGGHTARHSGSCRSAHGPAVQDPKHLRQGPWMRLWNFKP